MSNDPNQAPGGGAWPAPGNGGGTPPPTPGAAPDPVVYGHDQPTVPQGQPSGQTAWLPYESPVPTVEVAPPAKKGKGKIIAAVVGAVAVLAAGGFAVTALAGGGHDGGADSPEAAAEKLFEAIGNRDVLGMLDSLLPGERDASRERAERLVSNLSKLGVLSDDADLGSISGLEITLSDMEYDAVETNVDDITDVLVSGNIEASVNGQDLPIGDVVIDRFLNGERPDVDESDSGDFQDVMLTTVERGGRWYVSVGYTIAEYARTNGNPDDAQFDIPDPEDAIALNGGDKPEEAISNLIDAVEDFDLEGVLGTLDPREVGALQRYAPVFLGDAADAFSDLKDQAAVTFGDITYTVHQKGDEATVGLAIDTVTIAVPEGTITYDSSTQCASIDASNGDSDKFCLDELSGGDPTDIAAQIEQLLPDDPELADQVADSLENFRAAFDDLGPLGITVSKVDGKWYVSLLGTYADTGLTLLDALDRDEFESIIDDFESLYQAVQESSMGSGIDLPPLPGGG